MKTVNKKTSINNRKTELQNDIDYMHIMKYMGSKRELLPDIKKTVKKIVPVNSTILDLFAGTASVGAYLKHDFNIISNDIQSYSQVIAKSLIGSSSIELPEDIHLLIFNLEKYYIENKEKLIDLFPRAYAKSNLFVDIKKGEWLEKDRIDYLSFFNIFPSSSNDFKTNSQELKKLKSMYFKRNKDPYLQTCFLFSETYFSFEQAMDIDSIRYAIDMVTTNDELKSILLSALMYAYSYCSSGTGHFAMYRDIVDVSSAEDTFIYRKKRVWEYFIRKVDDIISYHQYIPNKTYTAYSMDYEDLLNNKCMKDVDLIYADPPYSFVHYSRFYHAVESLVKYDYDTPTFKGRYRSDRHQSPFCQKTNVKQAFDLLFKKAQEHKSNVLLSYSDTGMITLDEIKKIIIDNGFKNKVQSISYDHSTLGRKGHKSNAISEYLIQAIL
jgi:adenine-specific DNA-methyltransferase